MTKLLTSTANNKAAYLSLLTNLKLRTTIYAVFIAGFFLPTLMVWLITIQSHRQVLTAKLDKEHADMVQILALGLRKSVWTLVPEAGEALVNAVMADSRILRVSVDSKKGAFIRRNRERPTNSHIKSMKSPIIYHGRLIGKVSVDINMNQMEAILAGQSAHYFWLSLGPFLFSTIILFWVLNHKILKPLDRLLRQSKDLADIKLNQEFRWEQKDEMGTLGQSFEHTRKSLAAFFLKLKQSNARAVEQTAELKRVNTNLEQEMAERRRTEAALIDHKEKLEEIISQRTDELTKSNQELEREIKDRLQAETERKAIGIKLKHAEKMEDLGTLAGGVAHDLNNILSGIVSYPDLILMDIPEDSPIHAPLLTIQKAGEKAAVIVQDLLTLARRGVAANEVMDLSEVVSDYLDSPEHCKMLESHPQIMVKTKFNTGGLSIAGSRVHITKTVMNLVSNAIEAIQKNGVIQISIDHLHTDASKKDLKFKSEEAVLVLSVSDTGSGIREEDLEHVFEPFYTTKVMGQSGSGLGMAVVWGTVDDHNGHIEIQSEVGHGTIVTIYLPAAFNNKSTAHSEILEDTNLGNETILVVDDIAEQRVITVSMLERMGFKATAVDSGESALQLLVEHHFDLLILDMIMEPGIDGLETFRRCLKLYPNQRAVIASGYIQTDQIKEVRQLGHCYYIKKPFLLDTLRQVVHEALNTL